MVKKKGLLNGLPPPLIKGQKKRSCRMVIYGSFKDSKRNGGLINLGALR